MRVKICGITSVEDVIGASEAGADYIGLIFEPSSPRAVDLQKAAEIAASLPESVLKVGVFVKQSVDFIKRAVAECGLDVVQLHGGQDDAFAESLSDCGAEIWRVAWIASEKDLDAALALKADAVLLDARTSSSLGGTGSACDWNFAARLSAKRKIILAGGISPSNVVDAASVVNPFCIDANSGVEFSAGKKDISKIRELIKKVKSK